MSNEVQKNRISRYCGIEEYCRRYRKTGRLCDV